VVCDGHVSAVCVSALHAALVVPPLGPPQSQLAAVHRVLAGRVRRQLHFLGVATALAQLHAGTQVVAQRLRLRAEVLEEVVLLVDGFLQVVNQVLLARLQVLDAFLVRLGDLQALVGLVDAAVAHALLVDLSVFSLFRPRLHLPTVYISCPFRCIIEIVRCIILILLKHLVNILLVI